MRDKPEVSICVVTYNQERFIGDCLQSLVDQTAHFSYEVLVSDDCSTDSTPEIISGFSTKHPELIKPNFNDVNLGPTKNLFELYKRAKGKYIAHMDGDDIAFPSKIEVQFEVLESRPDCIMATHDVEIVNEHGEICPRALKVDHSGIKDLRYLLNNLPFFSNSSKMFRNIFDSGFYDSLPEECFDFELHVKQCEHGNIIHLKERLGCYRRDVGVATLAGKGLNEKLVSAKARLFEKALMERPGWKTELTGAYAREILYYAKGAFKSRSVKQFQRLIRFSVGVKVISVLQVTLFLLSYLPSSVVRSLSRLT